LIYKGRHSWFFKVVELREEWGKNNKKAYWVPTWAQENRFNNWR
jgi:isoleucyl-tRNA synthetase